MLHGESQTPWRPGYCSCWYQTTPWSVCPVHLHHWHRIRLPYVGRWSGGSGTLVPGLLRSYEERGVKGSQRLRLLPRRLLRTADVRLSTATNPGGGSRTFIEHVTARSREVQRPRRVKVEVLEERYSRGGRFLFRGAQTGASSGRNGVQQKHARHRLTSRPSNRSSHCTCVSVSDCLCESC
ncbi:hypothetical protein DAEQUDRAFT_391568 [Daedalea quercina L-15889]|uniref:Uncharacterized protein n=1 Tax=Daedalea quercina L-15889 TaxID=1314783 RepID=A0A165NVM0_9APHY|nr:hypothetical protein DAEQUDRAFT_391568 [Daedalea quercina L-15889]